MPERGNGNVRDKLIDEILDREQKMFLSVRARTPAPCQSDPRGFRLHRSSQFSVWSEASLRSYLNDLKRAGEDGRNLMTLKYARMEDLIPSLHTDPEAQQRIDRMVAVQLKWQRELASRYPGLMGRGRPLEDTEPGRGATSFSVYLRGELETYSAETLALLHGEVTEAETEGSNLTEGIYLHLVRNLGYGSLEDAESRIRQGKA
jgi:hypothetical protein